MSSQYACNIHFSMQATVLQVLPKSSGETWDALGFTAKAPASPDTVGLHKTKDKYHAMMRELFYRMYIRL